MSLPPDNWIGIPGCAYGGPYPKTHCDEKPSYADVFLESSGQNKIAVLKLLRSYDLNYHYYKDRKWYNRQLTLQEAKALADKPLSLIYDDVSYHDAEQIKEDFEKIGAKIQIAVISWK